MPRHPPGVHRTAIGAGAGWVSDGLVPSALLTCSLVIFGAGPEPG